MKSVILIVLLLLSTAVHSKEISYQEDNISFHVTNNDEVQINIEKQDEELTLSGLLAPIEDGREAALETPSIPSETSQNGFFTGCREISIPEGVTCLERDDIYAFSSADVVYLPSTLESVQEGTLMHIRSEIIFPHNNPIFVMNDGFLIDTRTDTLLYSAPSSYENEIPPVTHLGKSCLDNWLIDKTDVLLPDSISTINTGVFYDLPDLQNVVLPAKLTALNSFSFNSVGIREIIIPPSLTEIPAYCFVTCDLTSVRIPDGVERIYEYAFYYSWNVTDVTLSETVQFVGYNAFPEGCNIISMNPATHFETLEEYQIRYPKGEWYEW